MTGSDLQQLLLEKWGCSFYVQLRRVKGRVFLQIMWKYLEQASFPLSEQEYLEHLTAVANYLQAWGTGEQVRQFFQQTKERPRLGKAVSIPLALGDRAVEWMLDEN